jgi:CRISPR-associated protein Csb1
VLRKVEVFKGPNGWDINQDSAGKSAKKVRPSEINHGNIAPTVQPLGITCDYAEHTAVIRFAGLRRLGFGGGECDQAGRALLTALGLIALTEQDAARLRAPLALRSRVRRPRAARTRAHRRQRRRSGDRSRYRAAALC